MAAGQDVLGREASTYAGAFSADNAQLILFGEGTRTVGLLVQSIQTQYNQPIQTIFEVGSDNRYYVVGRPSGSMTIAQILGPSRIALTKLRQLGNPCDSTVNRDLAFTLGSSACLGGSKGVALTLTASGCISSGAAFSVTAEQMLVTQQVTLTFANLSTNV